ncbi:hypothetical protein K3495_g13261 [Podosphaera aphanis]|nr:hypothetical protein K3495_g13261 [Podosphaera aphanis]
MSGNAVDARYDVVVDVDEDGDLGHTDLHDDLEFHASNFSSSAAGKPTGGGLPAPATASAGGSSKRHLWALAFYAQFFDVDTTAVVARCMAALYPRVSFWDVLDGNPDLYGPIWIATTVVFILFLGGTINQYLSQTTGEPFVYDFTLLSGAAGLIYGYTMFVPLALFLALKYIGNNTSSSVMELWALYGYANLIWIPVAMVAWSPITVLNWVFVGIGFGLGVTVLLRNLYTVIGATDKQANKVLLILVIVLHTALAISIKWLFFKKSSLIADGKH